MKTLIRNLLLLIVPVFVLTACGGGGGGGGGGAPSSPTSLDSSFGVDGKVVTGPLDSNDGVRDIAMQSDGKIVVAVGSGTIALARYNADGTLDGNFGNGGTVPSFVNVRFRALAMQPDGKIVAAGRFSNGGDDDFAVARYNADGSPDTGFGPSGTGMASTGFLAGGSADYALAVAIQADNKIVVAGVVYRNGGSEQDLAMARFNADGSLDTSFNSNPLVCLVNLPCRGKLISLYPGDDAAYAVAVQGDGKIVAAGWASNGTSADFLVVRYNQDGSLDTAGFGSGTGKVQTGFFAGQDAYAYAVALQSDGKIVLAGSATVPNGIDGYFALARYNSDGTLDTSFNPQSLCVIGYPCSGQQYTDFGGGVDEIRAIALQADGKIVAAGHVDNGFGYFDFALARYRTDGSLDGSFGVDGSGKVTTGFFPNEYDAARAVAVQADGKIVAAGTADDGVSYYIALARFLP